MEIARVELFMTENGATNIKMSGSSTALLGLLESAKLDVVRVITEQKANSQELKDA